MADPADAKTYAQPRVTAAGMDWPTYEKQIQTESGWRHWAANGNVLSSPTGSMGLGQLNSKFYPRETWEDPYKNLDKSIEIMTDYLARFGSYRKALAGYNWGPANVAGYTKDGNVHPAWDGTREWVCPVGLPQCRTAQRDHYLDVILGPGWPEPSTVPAPTPTPEVPGMVVYQDFRDPAPAGRFGATPKGIILHGSRSGRAGNPLDAEYLGTANWEVNNPNDLGWNATIGEGKVAVHMTPQEWGWNARGSSDNWLAVEIAQPTVNDPVTDAQVAALVDWIKTRVLPAWSQLPMHFPTHAELDGTAEYGPKDGKTDVFPKGDARADELRGRIMAGLNGATPPAPTPQYAVGPGILAQMALNADDPATDEMYVKSGGRDMYSEAMGTSGAIYRYVFATNRTHRYDPAA